VEVFRGNRMCGDELCALDDAGWQLTGVGLLKARSLRLLLDRKVKAAELALRNVPMESSCAETLPEVAPLSVADGPHHHLTTFFSPPRPAKHVAVLPPNPTSPPLGSEAPPRTRQWGAPFVVDLTEKMDLLFAGEARAYGTSADYFELEWPLVLNLLSAVMRDDHAYECFWRMRFYKLHPARNGTSKNAWCKDGTPYPPINLAVVKRGGPDVFVECGVTYQCDHEQYCGCPRQLRIVRDFGSSGDVYKLYLLDALVRHGCQHTHASNMYNRYNQKTQLPSLHTVLKVYLQRKSFDHMGRSSLTWSSLKKDALELVRRARYLHCGKPIASDQYNFNGDGRKSACPHNVVMGHLAASGFSSGLTYGPESRPVANVRDSDCRRWLVSPRVAHPPVWSLVDMQLLEGHESGVGLCEFFLHVQLQCEGYLQDCNRRHRTTASSLINSSVDCFWDVYRKENLHVQVRSSLAEGGRGPPLDIWQWGLIGLCYDPSPPKRTGVASASDGGASDDHVTDTEDDEFEFFAVYGSIASIITYLVAGRKAHLVGWHQHLMDVVHEIGALVGNLNIFNVGVSDAKQTCHLACCALHHSRKAYVFEGTSAAFHNALRFVWSRMSEIRDHCALHGQNIAELFALTPDFFEGKATATAAGDTIVSCFRSPPDTRKPVQVCVFPSAFGRLHNDVFVALFPDRVPRSIWRSLR
jgi:hypothetical protein